MRYRNKSSQPLRKRVLILCEGAKTEPNYFNALKKAELLSALQVHPSKKNTAKELVDEALELKKVAISEKGTYESIWIVVDRDGYTKHPESFDRAKAKGIKIAFSSACFEYWILLHFEYTTASFANFEDVISRLKNHLPDYEKNVDYFELYKSKIPTAIKRSNQIIEHWNRIGDGRIWNYTPYTDVGILVEYLLGL